MTTWEEFKAESLKDPAIKQEYDAQAEEFRQISDQIRAEIHSKKEIPHNSLTRSYQPAHLNPSLA